MKIQVAGRIRYPDAFVACSTYPRDASVIDDPIVVFEVLSPSTARIDRIVKLGEYRDTPSIQRYVMLEQDFQAAIVLTRNGNDWVTTAVDADGTLSLPEIEVELPLADLYEGIEMPDDSVG